MSMADPKHGIEIPYSCGLYCTDFSKIPTDDELLTIGEKIKKNLADIIKSPFQTNGSFPAILCPKNHGVLWHEVAGHSLEAHRMQENGYEESSFVFKGKLGERVAPEFFTLYDDPTNTNYDAYYLFDEEGVSAQKVILIENGILKNFLHSRESAGYFQTKSNGHARAYHEEIPVSRMSNLFVKSSNSVPLEELKELLIKEVVNQRKEYGLMLLETQGGETLPDESFYNTYPLDVFRIYKNGKQKRVRGIYIVGTPHQTLMNIIKTSKETDVFNGFCGAESGLIPSAEIAPHALINSLEVNRIPYNNFSEVSEEFLSRPKYQNERLLL